MADNLKYNEPVTGPLLRTADEGGSGVHYPVTKLAGTGTDLIPGDATNGLDIDVTRVANGADVAAGSTTDAAVVSDTTGTRQGFLRGLVKIFASVWDSGNGRLKVDASAVAVPVTDNSGSLTVDGTVAVSAVGGTVTVQDGGNVISVDDAGGSLTVDGPLTDAQLRALAVAVSAAALPLPAGASTEATLAAVLAKIIASPATEATLALVRAKTDNLDVALSTRTKPSDQQHAIVDSSALPSGAATETTLGTLATQTTLAAILAKIIAAPATESTLALIKAKTDNLDVALSTRTKPADAQHTIVDSGTLAVTGALTDLELRATPVPVSGTVAATQGGTWTVQPGNTANTTAWKVDGSAVTQPVSGTFWPATQPVSGPLTDTQLRATPVPVSGTVTVTDGSGPLTVDASSLPLPTGAATEATLAAIQAIVDSQATAAETQPVAGGLTHNAAPPAAVNVGVLPAVASVADPTYSEGDQVLLSVGLDGKLRTDGAATSSSSGGDVTTREGLDCQAVYDPVVRRVCEQMLLEMMDLKERLFSEG